MCAPLTVEDLIRICGTIDDAERILGKQMVQAALAGQARAEARKATRIAASKPVKVVAGIFASGSRTEATVSRCTFATPAPETMDVVAAKALRDGWPDDDDIAEFYNSERLTYGMAMRLNGDPTILFDRG